MTMEASALMPRYLRLWLSDATKRLMWLAAVSRSSGVGIRTWGWAWIGACGCRLRARARERMRVVGEGAALTDVWVDARNRADAIVDDRVANVDAPVGAAQDIMKHLVHPLRGPLVVARVRARA